MVTDLTKDTFDSFISSGLVLIDFYAKWCPPCQRFMLVLPRLEENIEGLAKVGKVEIDENSELTDRFSIDVIPTFAIFKDGIEVNRWSGIKTVAEIENLLRTI